MVSPRLVTANIGLGPLAEVGGQVSPLLGYWLPLCVLSPLPSLYLLDGRESTYVIWNSAQRMCLFSLFIYSASYVHLYGLADILFYTLAHSPTLHDLRTA